MGELAAVSILQEIKHISSWLIPLCVAAGVFQGPTAIERVSESLECTNPCLSAGLSAKT